MADRYVQDYFGGAEGGAIFNAGDIVVAGTANFANNKGGVRRTTVAEKSIACNVFVLYSNVASVRYATVVCC